jgi:hypothetical protein
VGRLHDHGATSLRRVPGDDLPVEDEFVHPEQRPHRDRPPDVGHGHRVAAPRDLHQGIGAHHPRPAPLVDIPRVRAERGARPSGHAVGRALVGRTMEALIRDRDGLLQQPSIQLGPRREAPPGQRLALDVPHPQLRLPLGLGPIRPEGLRQWAHGVKP